MILSASRRTDIPCFYSEWFMNRIKDGFFITRNPLNAAQISRIAVTPDAVDCIVFWTKDAVNMLPRLSELDRLGYKYYFQFTLTPYGNDIERNLRPKKEIEDNFIFISRLIVKHLFIWLYYRFIIHDEVGIEFHEAQFARMCEKLSPFTDTVTISFVNMYAKLKTRLIRPLIEDETARFACFFGRTAKEHGLRAVACCENDKLSDYGIGRASCIDKERIEAICGCALDIKPDRNQRQGCGCAESIDIGMYNTCVNGCVYCYANDNPVTAKRRFEAHNPEGVLLTSNFSDMSIVKDKKLKSNLRGKKADNLN